MSKNLLILEFSRGVHIMYTTLNRDMVIFRFFKMASAAMLDFSHFKFLTVGRLKRADLRRLAKFGRNRLKCGRAMAIFRFFEDGGRRHLEFLNF